MSEPITASRFQAAEERPVRKKRWHFPLGGLVRRVLPVLLALAVLVPTVLAIGLESSLTQARAELNQVRQSGRPPAADGGIWYPPESEGGSPQGDTPAVPAADGPGREATEKLRTAYEGRGLKVSARVPPKGKDWNEFLQQRGPPRERGQR